jgi:hypothetical protein
MDHRVATGQRRPDRLRLGQIAHVRLARDTFEIR